MVTQKGKASHGPEETHNTELNLRYSESVCLRGLAAMAKYKILLEARVEETVVNCQLEGTSPILRNMAVDWESCLQGRSKSNSSRLIAIMPPVPYPPSIQAICKWYCCNREALTSSTLEYSWLNYSPREYSVSDSVSVSSLGIKTPGMLLLGVLILLLCLPPPPHSPLLPLYLPLLLFSAQPGEQKNL